MILVSGYLYEEYETRPGCEMQNSVHGEIEAEVNDQPQNRGALTPYCLVLVALLISITEKL